MQQGFVLTYVNDGFLRAETKPPDVVVIQLLDAQRQVGRGESGPDSEM